MKEEDTKLLKDIKMGQLMLIQLTKNLIVEIRRLKNSND